MFDRAFTIEAFLKILNYVPVTIRITLISAAIGLAVALVLTVMQLSKNRILNRLSVLYISLMRGSPMLVLLLLTYYGLPVLMRSLGFSGKILPAEYYAIVALSLNIAAYFSEAMRSAYLAVDKGQIEAGLSMRIKASTVVRRIIVPQAAVLALPNIKNSFVAVLKNSALVYAIGITDIYEGGRVLSNNTMGLRQLEVFISVTIVYWVLCLILEALFTAAEKKTAFFL